VFYLSGKSNLKPTLPLWKRPQVQEVEEVLRPVISPILTLDPFIHKHSVLFVWQIE
jgi:hypothetical protein